MSDPRVTDKVVGIAFAAFMSDKFAHPVQAMRSALEAAVPLLAPRPVVDREALRREMRKALDSYVERGPAGYYEHTDAVLSLLNGSES